MLSLGRRERGALGWQLDRLRRLTTFSGDHIEAAFLLRGAATIGVESLDVHADGGDGM